MVKLSSKMLAMVVSAIKNMCESKGSSSRNILNYISSVHDIPQDVAKRQMVAALKRGVAHGIIKMSDGFYSLPTDTAVECMEVAAQELGLLDLCCRRKKREARKKKGCKKTSGRKKRSRRKGKGCKGSRGRSRSRRRKGKGRGRKRCKGHSKSRRGRGKRGSRGKHGKRGGKLKRRSKRSKMKKCDDKALNTTNKGKKFKNDESKVHPFDNEEREFHGRCTSRTRSKSKSRSCSRNRIVVPTA